MHEGEAMMKDQLDARRHVREGRGREGAGKG